MAYQRLAGMSAFEFDYRGCLESARRAVEIAEQVGADLERVWALGFVALGYIDGAQQERGLALMDACFEEARAKGYSQIASNVAWNNIWTRTHMMLSSLEDWLERLESLPFYSRFGERSGDLICRSYIAGVRGRLEDALADAEGGGRSPRAAGFGKMGVASPNPDRPDPGRAGASRGGGGDVASRIDEDRGGRTSSTTLRHASGLRSGSGGSTRRSSSRRRSTRTRTCSRPIASHWRSPRRSSAASAASIELEQLAATVRARPAQAGTAYRGSDRGSARSRARAGEGRGERASTCCRGCERCWLSHGRLRGRIAPRPGAGRRRSMDDAAADCERSTSGRRPDQGPHDRPRGPSIWRPS